MREIVQDIKYGLRVLAKNRGYTFVAAMALALGIGANTAVFSVADAFLLKSVAVPTTQGLMMLLEQRPNEDIEWNTVAPANYVDWQRQSTSFQSTAAMEWDDVNLSGSGNPERVVASYVNANFFDLLKARPAIGRPFAEDEGIAGREQVVVLGHKLWQQHFGSDPAITGKTVRLNDKTYTVIGVMPQDFDFPVGAQLWMPLVLKPDELSNRRSHSLMIVARLKPGVSQAQAEAEMQTIAQRLGKQYPNTNRGWKARVMPIRDFVTGYYNRQYTLLLMYAVTFVLLIACANVANLQYARMSARSKELALRTALGASRWRVVRQLLTESTLLAMLGAVAGLALARWGVSLILAYMPPDIARWIAGWSEIRLDARAFAFALAIAAAAGIVAGIIPAMYGSSRDANEALKEGGRSATADRSRKRSRATLLVVEVGLAVVLLVGAGLMVKGTHALSTVNQHFEPEHLLTFRVTLPHSRYESKQQIVSFFDRALERLSHVPRVQSAALATAVPFGGVAANTFSIEGRVPSANGEFNLAYLQDISPNYFNVMRIPLLAGRGFSAGDGPDTRLVAVVSEKFVARYWPGTDPIGHRFKIGLADAPNPWLTVVGVVGDINQDPFDREIMPTIYRPNRQSDRSYATLILRTSGDATALASVARTDIAALDADLPVYDLMPMTRVIHDSVLGLSYVAVMLTISGVIALALACIGLFAVMAYSVNERVHEFGVRLALGASRRDLLRIVIGRGMLMTGAGLAVGLVLSAALARLMSQLIYGVSALDKLTFGGVIALLAAVSFLACYIPAHRAAALDPMMALKCE